MQGLPRGQKWGEHAGVWRDGAGVRKCLRGVRRGEEDESLWQAAEFWSSIAPCQGTPFPGSPP